MIVASRAGKVYIIDWATSRALAQMCDGMVYAGGHLGKVLAPQSAAKDGSVPVPCSGAPHYVI